MKNGLKQVLLISALLLGFLPGAQAETPLWTITTRGPTKFAISNNALFTISYTVTNQSNITHTLIMEPLEGIAQLVPNPNFCNSTFILKPKQSCILLLVINGTNFSGNIVGGPTICQLGPDGLPNPLQCYQPAEDKTLNLTFYPEGLTIGQSFGGGKISCLTPGSLPTAVSNADNSTGITWGPLNNIVGVPVGNTLGSINTAKIIANLNNNGGVPYAAMTCANYQVDVLGNTPCKTTPCYKDWFLPSSNEFACIVSNKLAIGGFTNGQYWSSNEAGVNPQLFAISRNFANNQQGAFTKNTLNRVRCARYLSPT